MTRLGWSPADTNALRAARAAEGVYAVVALLLALSLPWPPPRGPQMVTAVHWLGTGMLAGMLAWKLGAPNRAVWWVSVLLAAYTIVNGAGHALRLASQASDARAPSVGPAAAVAALVLLTQLVAAVSLARIRHVRHVVTATR